MCYAAFKGHFPIIHFMSEFFLKNYPIENVIKYFQRACIHAASNSSPKIVEYLSDYIQERCPWKRTLMHYACQNGHRRLLKVAKSQKQFFMSFDLLVGWFDESGIPNLRFFPTKYYVTCVSAKIKVTFPAFL